MIEQKDKLTKSVITIDDELRKQVRIKVAQLGTTIKSFCEEAIKKHLIDREEK